jgi:imidazolonepropionase-like amidohydrolase
MFVILITNVRIFDGSGTPPFPGKVLVEGDRIKAVARDGDTLEAPGARHIDGGGATLMPGLVEGHAHLTYPNAVDRRPPDGVSFFDYLSGKVPTEHHAFFAAHNARRVLDAGFTSAYSAGGATRTMEVSLLYESGCARRGPKVPSCRATKPSRSAAFRASTTSNGSSPL